MAEELTKVEQYEKYARFLFHLLKTEQEITFGKHLDKPEIDGLMFRCERNLGRQSYFHYSYIDEDKLIRKTRNI